jgi:transcriptional regulator with XRE-family HTH domain
MSKEKITLGYVLTKYRLKSNLTTEQLADKLSIEEKYLIALEKGDYHEFTSLNQPFPIIKRLSYVFGLKYNVLIELYHQEYEFYIHQLDQQKEKPKLIISHTMMRMSIGIIIGLIVVIYLGIQVYQLGYTPVLTLNNKDTYEINKNSEYTLIGNISRAGQLTLNGQKVTLKEDGKFEIILSLREGENRLELQVSKDNKLLKTTQKIVYKQ